MKNSTFKHQKASIIILLVISSGFFCSNANAQFFDRLLNPTVTVTINHPAQFGFKINKIAFGPSTGECGDQVTEAVKSDFAANHVEMYEREQLNAILAEHHFSLSGYADQASTAPLGKILGPTTLVFIKVERCNVKKEPSYAKENVTDPKTKVTYQTTAYYSKTRAELKASIRAIDLATGLTKGQTNLSYTPEKTNKSYDGQPVYPEESKLLDAAIALMARDVHRMFLSWGEQKELVFYNDKDGGLKQAFQALKAGDNDQALELSKQNVETCKNMPKTNEKLLGHAYYNLATAYMIHSDYDQALVNFQQAQKYRPGEIITNAIADCKRAIDLAASINLINQNAAAEEAKKDRANNEAAAKEASNTLTNKDIVKLSQQKLPASLIIQKIKLSKCAFDTGSDALLALTKAGVSEKVIMVMMEKR
jgi:tetratricopeptide (TPR) repeat protein